MSKFFIKITKTRKSRENDYYNFVVVYMYLFPYEENYYCTLHSFNITLLYCCCKLYDNILGQYHTSKENTRTQQVYCLISIIFCHMCTSTDIFYE